ncbi:MAG: T9SS type A sorting domain-containing protein [Spirosomataceae bacterium]
MNKSYIQLALILIIGFFISLTTLGAGYRGTITSLNLNRTGGTCTLVNLPTISLTNISMTINNRTSATLSFINNTAGAIVSKNTLNSSSFSSTAITFETFTVTRGTCVATLSVRFTSSANFFTDATIRGTLSIESVGAQIGNISSNLILTYFNGNNGEISEEANATASNISNSTKLSNGAVICSTDEIEIQVSGDNYKAVTLYIDGKQLSSPITPDNLFKVSNTLRFKINEPERGINQTDGLNHEITLEVNGRFKPIVTFVAYTPLPSLSVSANKTTSCYGEAIVLTSNITDSRFITYRWSDGATTGPTYRVDKPVNNFDYSLTINKGGVCPAKSNSIKIQVIPDFQPTISTNKTRVCEGDLIQINASPSDTNVYRYNWSNGGRLNFINASNSGNYSVMITPKLGNCTGKQSNVISNLVFDKQIQKAEITPSGNVVICSISKGVDLEAITESDVLVQWSTGEVLNKITVRTPGTYSVQFTRGMCSTRKSVFVDSKPLEAKVFGEDGRTLNDIIICSGTNYKNFNLQVTSNYNGVVYRWKLNNDNTVAPNSSNNNTYAPTSAGEYYVIAEVPSIGCSSPPSNKVKVIGVQNFSVALSPTNPPPICEGSTIEVSANPSFSSNLLSYKWQRNNNINLSQQGRVLVVGEEGTYSVRVEQQGCQASSSTIIQTKPSKPVVAVVDGINLVASVSTDGKYEWFFKQPPVSYNPNDYSLNNPVGTNEQYIVNDRSKFGVYMLRANRNNCGRLFSDPILINNVILGEETEEISIQIQPNPASQFVRIQDNNSELKKIYLIRSDGIISHKSNSRSIITTIDTINIADGIYSLVIEKNEKVFVKKIAIVK